LKRIQIFGAVLPREWDSDKIDNLASICTGGRDTKDRISDGKYPFYVRSPTVERIDSYSFEGTAILTAGDGVGTGKVFHFVNGKFDFHQRVYKLADFDDRIVPRFLYEYFQFFFIHQVTRFTAKTSVDSVRREMISEMVVPLPPFKEQERISEILLAWEQAISLGERLLKKLKTRKQALMQILLSGNYRLPKFTESKPWDTKQIGELTNESTARNKGKLGRSKVKAVSNRHGLIPMKESVMADSIERYKIVQSKQFAYNPMRINVGSISCNGSKEPVLVSPDYVVFGCNEKLLPDYLRHLRQTHRWNHYVNEGGDGSVRVRIYYSHLATFSFPIPDIEEQRVIADCLNAADEEIECLESLVKEYREQKRGLMQKLLTGRVRISVTSNKRKKK
jgi:type I restriction enzyme S subunit